VCSARDRNGLQSGKRSLFSKTRPSRADPFPTISPNILLQKILYFLSLLRSKRATLHINLHGRVCCFCVKRPEWPVTILRNGMHIQTRTVIATHIKPPPSHLSPPALPARYATLRSQLLQCTLIFVSIEEQNSFPTQRQPFIRMTHNPHESEPTNGSRRKTKRNVLLALTFSKLATRCRCFLEGTHPAVVTALLRPYLLSCDLICSC
jgi:hypothetical protein